MKLNLSRLVLTAGLSIGIISFASVAEAGITLNGTSLRGRLNRQPQPSQQFKVIRLNGTKLDRQSSSKSQLPQQLKKLTQNASRLTGQTSKQQLTQEIKGIETSP